MAMILDAFVGTFVEKLTRMAREKVVMVLGVKDELKKLQQQMTTIQTFLEEADRRQLEDLLVKHWAGRLKDVVYDADDIIDRCIIEDSALSLPDRPSSSKKLAVCFDFSLLSACFASIPHRYGIAKSIKLLNDKLEGIYKDMLPFNFEARREQPELQKITTVNTRRTSPLEDVDVLGSEIEDATKELVKLIVGEQTKKCRVFALTGMGGIGKTTLAQKIYNNEKIQIEFQNKVWLSISQNYDEIELLRQVIVKGAEGNHDDTRNEREHPKNKSECLSKNKTELLPLLQSAYHGKSLFLVLDDVWRVDVWIKLFRNPLQSASFLRILVTTRDENIARGMKAAHIHPVEQLSDQTCWDILCKKVFLDEEETEIGKLKDIGLQIVKKCFGLPLAINAIAGVLAKKEKSRREWEKVLKNDAWSMKKLPEELKGGLYLSYDDLPSKLKQCFLYFSLFPEDALIDRDDLVLLWVAEGFVEEQNDSLMEEVAEEYYNELLRRNLLQAGCYFTSFDSSQDKIHDLMRFLAKFLSEDEIATTPSSSTKLRRVSIETSESLLAIKNLVVEQKCLRTLLTFNGIIVLNDSQLVGLERLRVLRLENVDIDNIPDSIDDLIHLRYLNLGSTRIRALPESIGNLINLQFLNLSDCTFLTTLPKSITKLHNLRCLDLTGTPIISIPKGISKLEKINCFYKFVVADPSEPKGSYTSLEELLSSLYRLRKLSISKMERARSGALGFQKLTRLIQLELLYSITDVALTTEEDITRIEDALEELCPPQCLEKLVVRNFFGTHYPSWMKSSSFGPCLPCLTSLEFEFSYSQLPPLGELPELTNLSIYAAKAVKSIGSEFLGAGVCDIHTTTRTAFPKLQNFILFDMPELEEWSFNNETEGFERGRGMTHVLPCLKDLFISRCPKLKALPKGLEQCKIKTLFISKAFSLKEVENLPTVEVMKIIENQNLERVSNLPALYNLEVIECPSLNCVEKLDSLQQLNLNDYNMKDIQKYLEMVLEERKLANAVVFSLKITSDDTTLLRFLKGGPDWPIIEQIPQVIAYNLKGVLVMRHTKNPDTYTTYEVPE